MAAWFVYKKHQRPDKKNISQTILIILACNLLMYLLFFISSKVKHLREQETIRTVDKYGLVGVTFATCAILSAVGAIYFYQKRNSNRNSTPAVSKNLNGDCLILGFYDSHDLWHFLSAAAVFLAFLGLLTVDDDLVGVPRDKIFVY